MSADSGDGEIRFRTLRGFLRGEEPDVPMRFEYSSTLRIFGDIPDLDDITRTLQLSPSHSHRRGDRLQPRSRPFQHDMWSYEPPISEEEPLHVHIDALWNAVRAHKAYLLDLKKSLTVDVFNGYRSNCDTAGFEVPSKSLEMFVELQVPFGVSIIIA